LKSETLFNVKSNLLFLVSGVFVHSVRIAKQFL